MGHFLTIVFQSLLAMKNPVEGIVNIKNEKEMTANVSLSPSAYTIAK